MAAICSGAGKTTLLDVIAGRKTIGTVEGDILVNGHPKDQRTWSRVMGYVEQTDIHSPQVRPSHGSHIHVHFSLPRSTSELPTHGAPALSMASPAAHCVSAPSVASLVCLHRPQ